MMTDWINNSWNVVAVCTCLLTAACSSEKGSQADEQGQENNRGNSSLTPSPKAVSFNEHVRPILSDRCFACHGPDADNQESLFRLDSQEASRMNLAKEGEAARYGIVPGKPEESLLMARILHEDPNERMPPPAAKKKGVSEDEVAILRQWILNGAEYKKHWAFVPVTKPNLPAVKQTAWIRNDIDRFVLAKLESRQISPAPEADKETLIRRVYMDLTGLPPSPEAISAFVGNESPAAFEAMVDEVLASPHYGERLATDWLDAARYGDTNASHVDMMRTSWPWRDWVINAFNQNMPYSQFIIEQLAGDLLPDATDAQKVATSFNRNHPITNEGGVIPEEFLVEYAVDRVSTMGSAMMGLTLGCARCHDHKFDPISQDDFYSFMSFFNNIPERGLEAKQEYRAYAYPPFITVYTDEQKKTRASADATLQEVAALKKLKGKDAVKIPGDEHAVQWHPLALVSTHSDKKKLPPIFSIKNQKQLRGNANNKITQISDSKRIILRADIGSDAALTLGFKAPGAPFNTIRVEASPKDRQGRVLPEQLENIISEIEVELRNGDSTQTLELVSGLSSLPAVAEAGIAQALDSDPSSAWNQGLPNGEHHFLLQLKEPVTATQREVLIRFRYAGNQSQDMFHNDLIVYAGNTPHRHENAVALIPVKDRLAWHQDALLIDSCNQAGQTKLTAIDYFRAKVQLAHLKMTAARCMVMEEKKDIQPTYVLDRGLYDQPLKDRPRERVTPPVFDPMPEDAPKNRLGLAQWLVADSHPLTARFAVNRFWQQLFQHGIVKTSEDFGLQSDPPSHPELLDYLAVDFQENHWDVKRLMKMMVMSATYRQTSTVREELKAIDPDNRLLARAPRYRFPAEVIRDNSLAASGLLVDTIGGPSVKPYQPDGLWREKTMQPDMNTGIFRRDTGDKLYRRGMYTFWKQASPPPQMELFDAPSREACVMKRRITSTPLQALMLMNDETYLEMSRELATRLFSDLAGPWQDTLSARLTRGFLLTTGRTPRDSELEQWETFTNESLKRFGQTPEDATAFLSYGEKPKDPEIPEIELAALSFSMSALLNLDETLTRD
jgi:hypothetical protein